MTAVEASLLVNQRTWRTHYRSLKEYLAAEYNLTDRIAIDGTHVRTLQLALRGDRIRAGVSCFTTHDLRVSALSVLWQADGLPHYLWPSLKLRYLRRRRISKHRHRPWAYCKPSCKYHGTPYSTK